MVADSRKNGYGWSEYVPPSHAYLGDAIADMLRSIGAKRILDLGCGNGTLCHALSKQGFVCTGCDSDSGGIEIARLKSPELRFVNVGVYDDTEKLGESGFDAVVSAEVVEHLYSPGSMPAFARAVLRENGYLVVTTPYHGYLKNLILSLLDKWDSHHTSLWDGGHIKFWSRKTLTVLLEKEGFAVERFLGVGRFPYLWKSMLLLAKKQ
jgi:2-polyprenyl-3-methyl-5-hydroxy-6-metoxy-1,4-benzoquinol methylase